MRRIKRLCLIANPNIAHTQRWVFDFRQRGWDVHLIGEHALQRTPPENCTFYDLPKTFNFRKFRYLVWGLQTRHIIQQIGPTVVHSLGVASAGWLGAFAVKKPFLVTALGSDLMLLEARPLFHQWLSKFTLKKADFVICVSRPLFDKALYFGAHPSRCRVIHLGIDQKIFKPVGLKQKNRLRERLGLGNGPIVLGLRAISPIYRPLDLAQAIPIVVAKLPETRFLIFTYNADANLLVEFKQILHESEAQDFVSFIPPLRRDEEIAEYYQASDIAVSIPESDGMPVSVLEAIACGTSLVATDLVALKGLVENERDALIIPVGDIRALAQSIMRLIEDPSLRENMCTNAIKLIREQHDREQIINETEQLYLNLIS